VKRFFTHLFLGPILLRRYFPPAACARIGAAIAASEDRHSAEIRFCVEGALELHELLRRCHPRDRAVEVFTELRIWDTAQNNGVLIYLLLADRDIEIVADRGLDTLVAPDEWRSVCETIEAGCRTGGHVDAVISGVEQISAKLARHFPPAGAQRNELPNEPVVRP
jgi:hypothetical protein